MTYRVKWTARGSGPIASSPSVHEQPQSAFAYADIVTEVLAAMEVPDVESRVWVEDDRGNRIARPQKTTDS
jgi:hypothetical protein